MFFPEYRTLAATLHTLQTADQNPGFEHGLWRLFSLLIWYIEGQWLASIIAPSVVKSRN
jgi:hypothetical protein